MRGAFAVEPRRRQALRDRDVALISQRLGTGLIPHFLAPLGTQRNWFQADNLHPTAAAQPLLAEDVLRALDALEP